MTRIMRRLTVTLCATLLGLTAGCTKKDNAGETLADSTLLKRVPAQSAAFAVWDFERPAAKAFLASDWGTQGAKLIEQINSQLLAGSEDQTKMASVIAALQKAGLLGVVPGKAQASPYSEMIAFALINPEKKRPEMGALLKAAKNHNLSTSLATLQSELKTSGFEVAPGAPGAAQSFSIKLPVPESASTSIDTLYLAGTEDLLAVSTSSEHTASLLKEPASDGTERLRSSAQYKKLEKAMPPSAAQYFFSYVDAAYALENLESLLKEPLSEENRNELRAIPLAAIMFSQSMNNGPSQALLALLKEGTRDKYKWLSSPAQVDTAAIPGGALLSLSLDGNLLRGLKDKALADTPAESQEMIKKELAPLDSLKAFSISLLGAASASPIPGVVVRMDSSDKQALLDALKTQLGAAAPGLGLPMSDWQTKKIDSMDVSYMQSPMFGVGLFLTTSEKGITLASSEEALKQTLSSSSEAKQLGTSLKPGKSSLSIHPAPSVVFFGDFPKISELVNSLKGMLGAFTGGQGQVDQSLGDAMLKIGQTLVTAGYADDIIAVEQVSSLPQKKE